MTMTKKSAQFLWHWVSDWRIIFWLNISQFSPMGKVLVDELAGVRLCGFALAFDRLAKASTFVFNAKSSNCTPYLPCSQQAVTSNTGPIWVFPRIQPFWSDYFSSLGKVYSRQATQCLWNEVLSDINRCQESCISTKFNHTILLWLSFNSFLVSLQ